MSKYLVEVVTTEPQPIWPDSYLDEVIGAWTGPPPQRPEDAPAGVRLAFDDGEPCSER